MGTLEARVDEMLKSLDPEAQADYLLNVMDLIKEYTEGENPDHGQASLVGDFKDFKVVSKSTKGDIFRRLLVTEGHHELRRPEKVSSDFVCERCDAGMMETADASFVCTSCGLSKSFVQTMVSYEKEPSRKITKQCNYKRSNHLNDWLNTLQGRESTAIPEEILQAVRAELKKARITSTGDITPQLVYEYLKKLRLNKWYSHKFSICVALNGKPPPVMSPELEARLKKMFAEAEEPFEKWVRHYIPERKNMLHYGFLLYKLCELLGEDQYLPHFNLLKTQEKLHVMDVVWRKICEELNWQFIPTL